MMTAKPKGIVSTPAGHQTICVEDSIDRKPATVVGGRRGDIAIALKNGILHISPSKHGCHQSLCYVLIGIKAHHHLIALCLEPTYQLLQIANKGLSWALPSSIDFLLVKVVQMLPIHRVVISGYCGLADKQR
jgi:hypothetical protein